MRYRNAGPFRVPFRATKRLRSHARLGRWDATGVLESVTVAFRGGVASWCFCDAVSITLHDVSLVSPCLLLGSIPT